jgi:SAM-dependent methyltransferase
MTHALRLVGRVLLGRVPSRALWWGVANKLNYLLNTGNGRYGLELLYLEHPDPWNFLRSDYERSKYDHALACILKCGNTYGRVLDVGCSIGVFSNMLAAHFDEVTGMDLSREALYTAAYHNRSNNNVRFIRSDLRLLEIDRQYDAVICAEMLYDIPLKDVERVCRQLNRCLAPRGVLVTVMPLANPEWNQILSRHFSLICRETAETVSRPYEVVIFWRLNQPP